MPKHPRDEVTQDLTPTVVWLDAAQTAFAQDLARRAKLRFVLAGSSTTSPHLVAEALEVEPADDLRHALASTSAELALILAIAPRDAAALDARASESRPLDVLSLAPIPLSLAAAREPHPAARAIHFAPRFRLSPGFRAAERALPDFGLVATAGLSARCRPDHATLAGRLVDAMDTLHALLDLPESIDAAVRSPRAASGLRLAPSERLADLAGDLTANLRFSDGRSASLLLTDRGGRFARELTLIGESGAMRVTDHAFAWTSAEGATIDHTDDAPQRVEADADAATLLIADQLALARRPEASLTPPMDTRAALAMAEAALLSARTGQPESPATLLRMLRVG